MNRKLKNDWTCHMKQRAGLGLAIGLAWTIFSGSIQATELRIGVPLPEGTKEWKVIADVAKRIADTTKGTITLRLVSPGEKGQSLATAILGGELDGGLAAGKDFTALALSRDSFAYALPFTFTSLAQISHVREAMDSNILERVSSGPYQAMGIVDFGAAYAMSSQSLATPEDWTNRTIWIPSDWDVSDTLKSLGLTTVSLPPVDVLKGLGSGTVDTIVTPPVGAILKRWHTKIRDVMSMPFVYTYGIWILRDSTIGSLSQEDREVVSSFFSDLSRDLGELIQARDKEARTVFAGYEIEFIESTPAMKAQWTVWKNALRTGLAEEHQATDDVQNELLKCLEAFGP